MVSVVPVAVAAAAFLQLYNSGTLDTVTDVYFSLSIPSQILLLSVLFALVFIAVGISQFIDPLGHREEEKLRVANEQQQQSMEYPVMELKQCEGDREKFLAMYPMLEREIVRSMQTRYEMPVEAVEWCRRMMNYTVPGGKLNRGLTVLVVQRALHGGTLSEPEIARASVLGWATEFLQAFFLVADDFMDDSQTRRGRPCWYRVPNVGKIAINDSFLLESFVFCLLRTHFSSEPYYGELVELFRTVIVQTALGQLLDLTTSSPSDDKIDLDRFTLEKYKLIVKYKTAFYSFYLPVALGMITSGIKSIEAFDLAKDICCMMGEYFQIQDDYLDCFGDPETIGKVGTDIQENKCCWLVVQALQRATPAQRTILEQNYGQWDTEKVGKVKDLYKDLDLKSVFETYEENSYQAIQKELDKVTLMPRDVFELLLQKIYKRSK